MLNCHFLFLPREKLGRGINSLIKVFVTFNIQNWTSNSILLLLHYYRINVTFVRDFMFLEGNTGLDLHDEINNGDNKNVKWRMRNGKTLSFSNSPSSSCKASSVFYCQLCNIKMFQILIDFLNLLLICFIQKNDIFCFVKVCITAEVV